MVLLVLVITAVTSWGTYAWQHGKVESLNTQVERLHAQVIKLNDQIISLSVARSQARQTTPQPNANSIGYSYLSSKSVSILVYAPLKNATVTSPVAVIGEVPGNWSFEAQFPVQLKDSKGNIIARTSAHVLGSWQTDQFVPFSAQLTYIKPCQEKAIKCS